MFAPLLKHLIDLGWMVFPVPFMNTAIFFLARPLSLLNCSLLRRTFSDSWKVARIAQIFKEGSTDEQSNCRPISILPVLSCLFEKLVYNPRCTREIFAQVNGTRFFWLSHLLTVCGGCRV